MQHRFKRRIAILLSMLTFLGLAVSVHRPRIPSPTLKAQAAVIKPAGEYRAFWFAFYDYYDFRKHTRTMHPLLPAILPMWLRMGRSWV